MSVEIKVREEVGIEIMAGDEGEAVAAAVQRDNPNARIIRFPGYMRVMTPLKLVVNRTSVESFLGREWNTRDLEQIMANYFGVLTKWNEDTVQFEWLAGQIRARRCRSQSKLDFYQALSRELDWEPTYVDPSSANLGLYRTGVYFKDWRRFRDPFRMYYKEYVRTQNDKERTFHAIREAADRYGHIKTIEPRWLQGQKLYTAALLVTEYVATRTHAHIARVAPAQTLRIAAMNQAMDEMRHTQNNFYLAKDYNKYYEGFGNGVQWRQYHWILCNGRTYAEDALAARDVFEVIMGFNFCFEVCFTNLLFVSVPAVAAANGDFVFAQMQLSTQSDESRHMAIGQATIRSLLEEDERNIPILQRWFEKWYWRTHRLVSTATSLFLDYFGRNRVESFKEAFTRYVLNDFMGGLMKDLEPYGLRPPRFLNDSIREAETLSMTAWRLLWQARNALFFKVAPPNENDREWFRKKYPAWKHFEEYWDSDTPDINNFTVNCQICHLPCVLPEPRNPTIGKSVCGGRVYWFCSDGCKWIFDQEPWKYANDRTWTELGPYQDMKFVTELLGLVHEPPLGGALQANGISKA